MTTLPLRTCDTSVLVPALASWHEHHDVSRRAVAGCDAVPGHALLETMSVLTRLPAPHRIEGRVVVDALSQLSLPVITLSAQGHLDLLQRLTTNNLRGGAVYDALVAATAAEHQHVLFSRDRRARSTYEAVGVTLAPVEA